MSCCSDNYVVPGANPANVLGGVESVGAGTSNVTITGTSNHPLVNVTNIGGVTQVEGQIGNVNLNGIGMTIQGGFPVLGDVTFTTAVQNITGSNAATVTNVGGTYNINVPSALVNNVIQGPGITVTQPTSGVYQVASVVSTPVASINGLSGIVNITADGISQIQMNPGTNTINIATQGLSYLSPGLNVGGVTLGSSNSTINITSAGSGNIDFAVPPNVSAINPGNNIGFVSLQSTDNSVTITNPSPGNINLAVPPVNVGVTSINSNTGAINLVGIGATTVDNTNPSTISIVTSAVTFLSPGTNSGGVTLASSNSSVTITNPSPGIIDFAVPPAPTPTPPPTGSPNINVTSNVISLAYDTTTPTSLSVMGLAGPNQLVIPGGTVGQFRITPGQALIYAMITQKAINPNQGFICFNINIGFRTLLNANTNSGAVLNVYVRPFNAGIGTSFPTLQLGNSFYQTGFEPTVYCNFFLGSFSVPSVNILPNWDENAPYLSLYVENQFSTDIKINYVGDKGWGYIVQNNRFL
jgi:hypothetical protein